MPHIRSVVPAACLLAAFATAGCNGDALTVPGTGTLEVTTATTGPEPDPDGYTVQIDAGSPQAIGPTATIQSTEVSPGDHTVQLAGMAANCTVSGDNPRTVSVAGGQTASVSFAITCGATTGGIQVTTSTSGPAPDPDGYSVTVDGTDHGAIGASGQVNVGQLPPGEHQIGLSGIAANCQVAGTNPQIVTIVAGQSATVAFAVTCSAPPANAGSLRVKTATTGSDADPDGYAFAVDGGVTQPIGLSGTSSLANVVAGSHSVRLSGIAENCAVQGANPRSVTVSAGATADVSFAIACTATTGTIQVSVTTSGSPTDPDGYTVKLDGAEPGQSIAVVGSTSFSAPAGDHSIELTGVAANCSVTDGTSKTVTVQVGVTQNVSFTVTCAPPGGSQLGLAFVRGSDNTLEHRLFSVNADGTGLTQLSKAGDDHRSPVWRPDGNRIAFVNGASDGKSDGSQIAVMNADGSGARDLTSGNVDDNPVWSSDGSKLMLRRGTGTGASTDIFVMNADGTGQVNVTNNPSLYYSLAWSPLGDKIGFTRGNWEILVANPDGSGIRKLTDGIGPVWSPDGARIAFVRVIDLVSDIWTMNSDGGDQRQLTHSVLPPGQSEGGAGAPAWSPDGRKIAFHSGVVSEHTDTYTPDRLNVFVMNADGSGQTQLTNEPASMASNPRWSPNGHKIAFPIEDCCNGEFDPDIVVMNADGTGRTNVTQDPGPDFELAWKP